MAPLTIARRLVTLPLTALVLVAAAPQASAFQVGGREVMVDLGCTTDGTCSLALCGPFFVGTEPVGLPVFQPTGTGFRIRVPGVGPSNSPIPIDDGNWHAGYGTSNC